MKSNRIIAGLIALCLVCGGIAVTPDGMSPVVSTTAVAESSENISWTLENGVLTISGTGDMPDYEEAGYYYPEYPQDERYSTAPWGEDYTAIVEVVIEDGITSISNLAFYNCMNLKKVTLPNSITKIGKASFARCMSMESINIPENITAIDDYAFYNCNSIPSITLPDSLADIGRSAFSGCSSITSITIPDGITVIKENSFRDCKNLTSLTIPDSVTTIEYCIIEGCDSLTSIDISEYVTDISYYAFAESDGLTDINISENNPNYSSEDGVLFNKDKTTLITYSNGRKDKSYTVPDTVTTIGQRSFDCCDIESVVIPDNVTTIEYGAFWSCHSLKSLKLSDNLKNLGELAFYDCIALESVDIPASLENIEKNAFYNCTSLKSVNLSDNLKVLGESMFSYCGVTSLTIPKSITSIPREAFYNCKLSSIDIPDTLKDIGAKAFGECNFTSVTVPETVESICPSSFLNDNLKEITILNPDCMIYKESYNSSFTYNQNINRMADKVYGYLNSTADLHTLSWDTNNFIALNKEYTTLIGDVNYDGEVNISDSVLIMQSINSPDIYNFKTQQQRNADTVDRDDGITPIDALAIQMIEAKIITQADLPITSEKLNELIK